MLTRALGIGVSSAVFTVAYGVLIDPIPYKDVHTLATPKLCWLERAECGWRSYGPQQFNEIAQNTHILAGEHVCRCDAPLESILCQPSAMSKIAALLHECCQTDRTNSDSSKTSVRNGGWLRLDVQ